MLVMALFKTTIKRVLITSQHSQLNYSSKCSTPLQTSKYKIHVNCFQHVFKLTFTLQAAAQKGLMVTVKFKVKKAHQNQFC